MSAKTWIPAAFVALALACSKGGTSPTGNAGIGAHACDPLAVDAEPLVLGEIVAAGKAADGTVYVLDRASTNLRAFVSEGTFLRRRNVLGSGEGPDFVIASVEGELQIRIEIVNGAVSRMGISHGPVDPKTKSFDIATQGEQLTLISASDLSSFQLTNIAGMRVTYAATTDDGHRFLLLSPVIDYSDDKLRLFYGKTDEMLQRKVIWVSYDSSIHVAFDLDGVTTTAQLNFCTSCCFGPTGLQPEGGQGMAMTPDPGSAGSATCAQPGFDDSGVDGGTDDGGIDAGATFELADDATLIAGMRFVCFLIDGRPASTPQPAWPAAFPHAMARMLSRLK